MNFDKPYLISNLKSIKKSVVRHSELKVKLTRQIKSSLPVHIKC